jgi:hypothetical protein
MLGWFKKNDRVYAERLYETLAAREVGNITPQLLGIPKQQHKWYRQKALLFREFWCLCALSAVARKLELSPVLRELEAVVRANQKRRGFDTSNYDDLLNSAFDCLQGLREKPMEWAQGWLKEFDAKPDDGALVFLKFAEHWMQQFEAVTGAILKIPRAANRLASPHVGDAHKRPVSRRGLLPRRHRRGGAAGTQQNKPHRLRAAISEIHEWARLTIILGVPITIIGGILGAIGGAVMGLFSYTFDAWRGAELGAEWSGILALYIVLLAAVRYWRSEEDPKKQNSTHKR